jgi:hypothetical protein
MKEGEFIEMSAHFRKVVEEKDEKLKEAQKLLFLLYGLIRATDDNFEDLNLIELARSYLSNFVEGILEK